MVTRTKAVLGLVAFVAPCFAAAGLGSIATSQSLDTWYEAIQKPSWTPPRWLFGPVWSVLYLLMAVAAWRVWLRRGLAGARLPLALFAVQLALNTGWSWLFFGLRSPGVACAEIVALWLAIAATVLCFRRAEPLAAWLMVPYVLWSTFAVALNVAIWRLNA